MHLNVGLGRLLPLAQVVHVGAHSAQLLLCVALLVLTHRSAAAVQLVAGLGEAAQDVLLGALLQVELRALAIPLPTAQPGSTNTLSHTHTFTLSHFHTHTHTHLAFEVWGFEIQSSCSLQMLQGNRRSQVNCVDGDKECSFSREIRFCAFAYRQF